MPDSDRFDLQSIINSPIIIPATLFLAIFVLVLWIKALKFLKG